MLASRTYWGLLVAICLSAGSPPLAAAGPDADLLMQPEAEFWSQEAPARFDVRFITSEGEFVVEAVRQQAPIGVDRFYNLVRAGFYDDSRFFRVREAYIAQFGIAGDPAVNAVWRDRTMLDDPVQASNTRGSFAYAMIDPDTRTTQIYINLVDNTHLDEQGFSPLGHVTEGMDVVDRLYPGYGEEAGGGMRLGKQETMFVGGNEHLDASYPLLTKLMDAEIEERRDE